MIDGAELSVAGKGDLLENGADGKLVRVSGILKVVHVPAAKLFTQGPMKGFTYYEISEAHWKIIERVDWPWLKELP